ncbi:hypothetical protein GCM10010123_17230 [Pilimelia anulata]|uniref:Uncharacterized protein n=1 Tax=Pilimelia anulata TaxID=53371 RepID=A0A8J3B1J3_9ACTN|nr:hypothetical protein [Pilimelia anulata]GGJ88180.1 hypothetical protein GCM10010123_17230 [Pilimelia anulata]
MGLENVAVVWPRIGDQYQPANPAGFADFHGIAEATAGVSGAAAALADAVAKTATVPATPYTGLVDLLLGLDGVLYATEAAAEDEDPVIDPDGCAWIAGGLERFVAGHEAYGERVEFASVGAVMRAALADGRLAEQQLRWLDARLDALRDADGRPPQWSFARTELAVLARFYRHCATTGHAVYAAA